MVSSAPAGSGLPIGLMPGAWPSDQASRQTLKITAMGLLPGQRQSTLVITCSSRLLQGIQKRRVVLYVFGEGVGKVYPARARNRIVKDKRHERPAPIGGRVTGRGCGAEPEAAVIGGRTEDEDGLPFVALHALQSVADQGGSDAGALDVRMDPERRQGERSHRRFQPAEQNVAD